MFILKFFKLIFAGMWWVIIATGALIMTFLLLLVLGIAAFGCTECKTADLACHGDKIEICNAAEQWEEVVNCAELEPGQWVCVEIDTDQGTLYPVDCVEREGVE